jgi:hypothetical protein
MVLIVKGKIAPLAITMLLPEAIKHFQVFPEYSSHGYTGRSAPVPSVKREMRQRRAFVIVHRSFVICHFPEIARCSLGIDRLLRPAMTNDK